MSEMLGAEAEVQFSIKNDEGVMVVNTKIDASPFPEQKFQPPIPNLKVWQQKTRNQILFPVDSEKNFESRNIVKNFANVLFNQNEEIKTIIRHKLKTAPPNSTIAYEIIFSDRETAAYPWEACAFIWDELGVEKDGRKIVVVRTPTFPQKKWHMFEPIKILVGSSSPIDSFTTNITKEYSVIEQALKAFLHKELFELPRPISDLTIHNLGAEIKKYQPNVVHLVTHGEPNVLEFENVEGYRVPVSPAELMQALNEANENLLLFVSTACLAMLDSGEYGSWGLGKALSQTVPLSVGMQLPVKSQHSIEFSQEFYTILARSKSVLNAFVAARDILHKNEPFSPVCIAPVLYRGILEYENAQLFSYQDMPQFVENSAKELWKQLDALRDDARNMLLPKNWTTS